MIKVGSEVFVKGYKREGRRKVERFQRDIEGGVKLDRPVGQFYLWNAADLIEAGPRTEKLTRLQRQVLACFRGTGEYVGKDARMRGRLPSDFMNIVTLLSLRRRGLLEFAGGGLGWYLTEAGREYLRCRK